LLPAYPPATKLFKEAGSLRVSLALVVKAGGSVVAVVAWRCGPAGWGVVVGWGGARGWAVLPARG